MEDLPFCPKCGRQRGEGEEFCPKCGRAYFGGQKAEPPPIAPTSSAKAGLAGKQGSSLLLGIGIFVALGLLWYGATSGTLVIPFAVGEPARVPCGEAQTIVYQRHSTIYGLMRTFAGPFDMQCSNGAEPGSTAVRVRWTWGNRARYATYTVAESREVVASDGNANTLDTVSNVGTLGIGSLMGLLQ